MLKIGQPFRLTDFYVLADLLAVTRHDKSCSDYLGGEEAAERSSLGGNCRRPGAQRRKSTGISRGSVPAKEGAQEAGVLQGEKAVGQ